MTIGLNCPEYRGARCPEFNEHAVNESVFEDDLRAKSWSCEIRNGNGHVSWIAYAGEDPTEAWENEVKRAFKANGLKPGSSIYVRFGSRANGYVHEYELHA